MRPDALRSQAEHKRSYSTPLLKQLDGLFASLADQSLLLAFSAGLDSTVLLHLLVQARSRYGVNLQAVHVHHGLQLAADEWASHCVTLCRQWQVPLQVVAVRVARDSGLGLEAAARQARYAALHHAAKNLGVNWILTAHHQRDQAETLLLQLMRGAGVKGLAAMAKRDTEQRLLRPLLAISPQQLLQYAKEQKLIWCEDASNQDIHYTRNWIRHQLLPVLLEGNAQGTPAKLGERDEVQGARRAESEIVCGIQPGCEHRATPQFARADGFAGFPQVLANIARSAMCCAEASHLLDELAKLDAQTLFSAENQLKLTLWKKLSSARAKNVLRWWCGQVGLLMPSAAVLEEMYQQLISAKSSIRLLVQGRVLSCYEQRAYWRGVELALSRCTAEITETSAGVS